MPAQPKNRSTPSLRVWAVVLGIVVLFAIPSHARDAEDTEGQPSSESALAAAPTPDDDGVQTHSHRFSNYPFRDRFHDYLQSTYQPSALIGVAVVAGYDQMVNYPPEWRQGARGFGRRAASSYGAMLTSNTIVLGIASLDHEDTRYVRCECAQADIPKRIGHVFGRTIWPPRDNGGHTFAFSRVIGDYGAGFVANTWYPAGHSNVTNAVRLGSVSLAMDFGVNLLREFIHPHILGWN